MENQIVSATDKTKKFLKRYRNNKRCILRLEKKCKTLDYRIKAVGSTNLSGMPRGGTPVTKDELIGDKIDLENRIKRLEIKGKKLKREILDVIDQLDDARYCEILEAYFIDCLDMEDIAIEYGYTERHVRRLYSASIDALTYRCQ